MGIRFVDNGRSRSRLRTRGAVLPDVEDIRAIIQHYSTKGVPLPRTIPELSENVRDFIVAEEKSRIVGCGLSTSMECTLPRSARSLFRTKIRGVA